MFNPDIKKAIDNLGVEIRVNEPMSAHTSFKIGGCADCFVLPKSLDELKQTLELIKEEGEEPIVIGNGSNLLVSDNGIRRPVISTLSMKEISLVDENHIFAAAGASLTAVCLFARDNSLGGLEFAYGIPGSVGGAVYMNAGAYGGEMAQVIEKVCSLDDKQNEITRVTKELDFGYRKSVFVSNTEIITGAVFSLKKADKKEITETMETLMAKRKASQPLNFPSAGSTFKRPEGYFAAALIDECKLKGFSVGGAEVSEKHAGFVINKDNATCSDVLNLIEEIKRIVLEKKGVELETEVIYLE